ncbi:winged helix-turn-helix domain-containing protein [Saccharothrix longispora]|uniref:winged helix-turn-helix domain-containing protein n=1 Tax=Saccharothrix longispora TaxID=33920 RepID=UPI0028FD7595|nr:winged helix-turn-helix domain-containing protein [Saccharothrix longispora]MBY8848284.1 winged helix-turn-helix domain-containing protein [Saccharothrix sp. MB29]MDU0289577.1 winged helix-turn-helix domain-containing protein [Saccharothrix longispora]
MQRIYFGPQDVARIRLRATLGAASETSFAGVLLVRRTENAVFGAWRRRVRVALGPRVPPVTAQDLHAVAVAPYWTGVHKRLEAERDVWARLLLDGVDGLLSALHPRLAWHGNVLVVEDSDGPDIDLDGRGLVIAPTMFLRERVPVRDAAEPVLVCPVGLDPVAAARLWESGGVPEADGSLAALIGRTRAAVLHALTDSDGTGRIGERLGLSSAVVSKHIGVLRDAGLVTSRRRLTAAVHVLTPLGAEVLRGHRPPRVAAVAPRGAITA